jgi:hypothetical protein
VSAMALATPLAGIASNHAAMSIITPDDEQNRGALGSWRLGGGGVMWRKAG